MAYTYTLLVDGTEKFAGTFPDSQSLAADAVAHAEPYGNTCGDVELAGYIDSGFVTIDLRGRDPHVVVRVLAA